MKPRIGSPFLALLTLFAISATTSAEPKTAPATRPATVTIAREAWTDGARNRTLPVKIYLPTIDNDNITNFDIRWPVIFVSYGLGGSREGLTYVATHWAEHGFVVITLQHPGTDDSVWRGKPPADVLKALQDAISVVNYKLRCEDVRFAIDHLAELAKTDDRFTDKLDLDHIGLAGHSFGAQTVQGIVGQSFAGRTLKDDRVKAAIAFSPGVKADSDAKEAFANVDVPIFHFTGTKDTAPLVRDLTPDERRIPYDNIVHNDQYLLILKDGDHAVFNGTPQRRVGDTSHYEQWHELIKDASLLFWKAELTGDADAKRSLDAFDKPLGDAGTFEHKSNP